MSASKATLSLAPFAVAAALIASGSEVGVRAGPATSSDVYQGLRVRLDEHRIAVAFAGRPVGRLYRHGDGLSTQRVDRPGEGWQS